MIRQKGREGSCFGEMLWWAARTSNPVDAAKRSGSIPPPERFLFLIFNYDHFLLLLSMKFELTPLKAGLLAAGIVGIGFFLKSMLEQDKTPVEVGGLSVE